MTAADPFIHMLISNGSRTNKEEECILMKVKARWMALSLTAVLLFLSGCSSDSPSVQQKVIKPPANPHAVVDAAYTGENGAQIDGAATYSTMQGALDAAPAEAAAPHVIFIKNGKYHEKLTIDKPYITLIGESRDGTVLSFDATAGAAPGGTGYGTSGSASITVKASKFRAENLTIENSFDYPANAAKADNDPTKIEGSQAVALRTDKGSEQSYFENVKFLGYQDTLYVNYGKQYFKDCYIAGVVDFIFGAGQAVFDNCDILFRDRGNGSGGVITAASTSFLHPYGFLFVNSRLLKENDNVPDDSVALGRPWHPGGDPNDIGQVVFLNTYMDGHISAKGWEPMGGFKAEDARFFEYGSTGPGAKQSATRRVLSEQDAAQYTITNVLGGWDPATIETIARE